jgi:hypothetical protein
MMGIDNLGWLHRRLLKLKVRNGVACREERHSAVRANYPACGYESPRLMVVGRVRKLSTGSSSSGKADANSQYYW